MLFNTLNFLIFILVVCIIFYFTPKRWQAFVLTLSSAIFYMYWDIKFIFLVLFCTLIDYFAAIRIEKSINIIIQRFWLLIALISNLSVLSYFKYSNFILSNLNHFLVKPISFVQVILPVGISFYTFQSISYTVDVYRKKIKAEKSFLYFFLYVLFFPQLVAGPIERADHMLKQFKNNLRLNWQDLDIIC